MRVPRIYQDVELQDGISLDLNAAATQHLLKVLRLRNGAPLIVFDGRGKSCHGTLSCEDRHAARIDLQDCFQEQTQSPLRLHVGLGISKGERMDYAIQKLVETGVHEITPLVTEHTVVKLDKKREQSRLLHWQGITTSACEQSGRSILPLINPVSSISDWINTTSADCKLVFDAIAQQSLRDIAPTPGSACVLIGPEGGLSRAEVENAGHKGFVAIRLGPRILRTETAAVAVSAALQVLWGDY